MITSIVLDAIVLAPVAMSGHPDVDWIGTVRTSGAPSCPIGIRQAGRNRELVVPSRLKHGELETVDAGDAFYKAIDELGHSLWQHNWNAAVGEIYSLNRRTLQRDRVSRFLLPQAVVRSMIELSCLPNPAVHADLLVALARSRNALGKEAPLLDYVHASLKILATSAPDR